MRDRRDNPGKLPERLYIRRSLSPCPDVPGSRGRAWSRTDFDVTVDLLRRHGPRLAKTMITHRFPLERIAEAFETAADKTKGSIKVTIAG